MQRNNNSASVHGPTFQRSSRSAFNSPEKRTISQPTLSSSAPPESPIRIPPPKGAGQQGQGEKNQNRLDRNASHQKSMHELCARCKSVSESVKQLKEDRTDLLKLIESSQYNDKNLKDHLLFIQNLVDSLHDKLSKESEQRSHHIWKDLHAYARKCIQQYEQHLLSLPERQELQDVRKCLMTLDILLQGKNEEDSKITCSVCFEKHVQCSFKCGHLLCADCTQKVATCPICRAEVLPEDIRPIHFN